MARTSRLSLVLALSVLAVACGGEPPEPTLALHVDAPTVESGATGFRFAVFEGRTTGADAFRVSVRSDTETCALEALPGGVTMAFRRQAGTDLAYLRRGLAGLEGNARLREPGEGSVFVVDVSGARPAPLSAVLACAAPPPDLAFLIEVLPSGRYRAHDGQRATRLGPGGTAPWSGSDEAFDAFKLAEVARFVAARAEGGGYAPLREGYRVAPLHGTAAAEADEFVVLEIPADLRQRFGRTDLRDGAISRDPAGRPAVIFEVRDDRQADLGAWTEANVGLPIAIVVAGTVRSRPVVQARIEDSVMITLGSGNYRELEHEARSLIDALEGVAASARAGLVVSVRWGVGGVFEACVPVPETSELRVGFEVDRGDAPDPSSLEFPLRHVPGVPTGVPTTHTHRVVLTRLAALEHGLETPEFGADALRSWLPESVIRLAEVLGAEDVRSTRREGAARLLGVVDLHSAVARSALLGALDDTVPRVRAAGAKALARFLLDDAALERLGGALADPESAVVDAAAESLAVAGRGHIGTVRLLLGAAGAGSESGHDGAAARFALREMLPAAAPKLRGIARGDFGATPAERVVALQVLPEVEDAGDVALFVDVAFGEAPVEVRVAALGALSLTVLLGQGSAAVPPERLAPLLEAEDGAVAGATAHLLALIGEEARPVLLGALASERPGVRWAGVSGLVNLEGDESSEALVRALLDDEWPKTRLAAAWVLARWTREVEPFLGALRVALRGDDREAATLAIASLQMLGPAGAPVADDVRPYLDDTDNDTRIGAALALEAMQCGDERTKALVAEGRED